MNNDNLGNINEKKGLLSRIKSIKNIKLILIILVFVVVLLSVDYFTKDKVKPSTMNNEELRLANIINQIDGVESVEVYINYGNNQSFFENNSEIEGVLVVCHGNKTVVNKLVILNALQKALNINKDIIEILIL